MRRWGGRKWEKVGEGRAGGRRGGKGDREDMHPTLLLVNINECIHRFPAFMSFCLHIPQAGRVIFRITSAFSFY